MILKQVNKIKDFGVFQNYAWQGIAPKFSTFNLTYGWNYSGKTTFSRVLRCFETGTAHIDYSRASFEIEDNQGTKHTEASFPSKLPLRVFNTDYISENLRWNQGQGSIEPILLLGQQNIQLQDDLQKEKQALAIFQASLLASSNNKKTSEDRINGALTNKAREIKNTFALPDYTKVYFEPKVQKVIEDGGAIVLSDTKRDNFISIYKSTEKKNTIDKIKSTLPEIDKINMELGELLNTTVSAQVIEKLKSNPKLNEWVRTGKEFHEGKSNCEFCGNSLPSGLLEHLSNHFSQDYEILLRKLSDKIQFFRTNKLAISLPDFANFYSEFQSDYTIKKTALLSDIATLNKLLDNLISKLEEKKLKVFEKMPYETTVNSNAAILKTVTDINTIIDNHNKKTAEFEKQRADALERLIYDYAVQFSVAEKYVDTKRDIEQEQVKAKLIKEDILKTEEKIKTIEQQLSETVKGAEKINEYLSLYFGKDDIKVKVALDNKFQLMRAGSVARNLSEGEKTAIAFAYFITSLEDKNTVLSQTVVYIDDPVSSLDSNHLFNTYSFIKDKFYEYDTTVKKHKCKAAQFFIATHNYEFFNLIKDWFDKMKKEDKSFYLIERSINAQRNESIIKELPIQLLKFKSEYSYLFSIIIAYKTNPHVDFEHLYNLPNVIRRFIEIFTAFKYLSTRNIEENMDRVIPDKVKCERVRKFVHYHSHSLNTDKLLQFSDLTECNGVIDILLESIKTIDAEHYSSLLAETSIPSASPATVAAV